MIFEKPDEEGFSLLSIQNQTISRILLFFFRAGIERRTKNPWVEEVN